MTCRRTDQRRAPAWPPVTIPWPAAGQEVVLSSIRAGDLHRRGVTALRAPPGVDLTRVNRYPGAKHAAGQARSPG